MTQYKIFIILELVLLALNAVFWQGVRTPRDCGCLIAVVWLYYNYMRIWDKMGMIMVATYKIVFCLWCDNLWRLSLSHFLLTYISMLLMGAMSFAYVNKIDIRMSIRQ